MNCPNCTGKNYVEYSLNTNQGQFNMKLEKYFEFNTHSINKCNQCTNYWYSNYNYKTKIFSLNEGHLAKLQKWLKQEHTLNKNKFDKIHIY